MSGICEVKTSPIGPVPGPQAERISTQQPTAAAIDVNAADQFSCTYRQSGPQAMTAGPRAVPSAPGTEKIRTVPSAFGTRAGHRSNASFLGIDNTTPTQQLSSGHVLQPGTIRRFTPELLERLFPGQAPERALATLTTLNAVAILQDRMRDSGSQVGGEAWMPSTEAEIAQVLVLAEQIAKHPERYHLGLPSTSRFIALNHLMHGQTIPEDVLAALSVQVSGAFVDDAEAILKEQAERALQQGNVGDWMAGQAKRFSNRVVDVTISEESKQRWAEAYAREMLTRFQDRHLTRWGKPDSDSQWGRHGSRMQDILYPARRKVLPTTMASEGRPLRESPTIAPPPRQDLIPQPVSHESPVAHGAPALVTEAVAMRAPSPAISIEVPASAIAQAVIENFSNMFVIEDDAPATEANRGTAAAQTTPCSLLRHADVVEDTRDFAQLLAADILSSPPPQSTADAAGPMVAEQARVHHEHRPTEVPEHVRVRDAQRKTDQTHEQARSRTKRNLDAQVADSGLRDEVAYRTLEERLAGRQRDESASESVDHLGERIASRRDRGPLHA